MVLIPAAALTVAAAADTAGSASEKLDVIRHDFDLGTVLTVLFPPVLTEFTVNPYLFSFYQVLIQGLSLPSPKNDVEKVRLVYPLIA
jgi:hypothetical protein